MNRRNFSLQCAGLAGTAALASLGTLPTAALAQGAAGTPVEGKDFLKLKQPLPPTASGKIEVVEFFWYGCPHCHMFEPALSPWVAALPADVHFRRVPVSFNDVRKEFHQRIFYTLEAMGQVGTLHSKVFARFHAQNKPLDREADLLAFVEQNGVDAAKFKALLNSFGVQTKMRQADQLSNAYNIDGVPALGFQGRFLTSPAMAGSLEKAVTVADYLVNLVRRSA